MKAHRKRRLILILALLLCVSTAVGLMTYALRQNINLYFTPSQVSGGEAPTRQLIRLGGMVAKGSFHRDPHSLSVAFDLTDYQHQVHVRYTGILPTLFREGQGIVVQGQLGSQGELDAIQVLAKHDNNYMPPGLSSRGAKVVE